MAKQDDEVISDGGGRPQIPLTNSEITHPVDSSDPNSTDMLEDMSVLNARLADCSMSSVTGDGLVLSDDEVDRLVAYEALPSLVTNTSNNNSGDNAENGQAIDDMFRDMSIVNDQRRDSAPSSVPSAPSALDSPIVTMPRGQRYDPILGQARQHRPFDEVAEAGPALNPVPFPPPKYAPARRVKRVLCYNEHTQDFFFASNVLIRMDPENVDGGDSGGHAKGGDGDLSLRNVDRAYWKMPHKANMETRMGHLEKCHVLKRMEKGSGGMDDSSDAGSESSDSDSDDDGDVVFVLTDECVAVKVNYCDRMQRLSETSPHSGENPLVEIAALQQIGTANPHLLGSIEALYDGQTLSVVLPYCDGGDLHDLVLEHQMKTGTSYGLPEEEAKKWFRQLLAGLSFLHNELHICHRDLSPENLILKDGKALIIDMGMCMEIPYVEEEATRFTESTPRQKRRRLLLPQGVVGKLPYMSPETYRNAEPFDGFAIDMWTTGTTLFFLLSGAKYEQPFDPIFEAMTRDLAGLLPHWGIAYLSPQCIDMMQRLMTIDPRHRLTLEEALSHPWLRDVASPQHQEHPQAQQRQISDNSTSGWLVV